MSTLRIGRFRIDPASHAVDGPDGRVSLEPKVMGVLVMLAERRGEVVTRTELVDQVWGREYGGDESLTRAVSLLRKALGGRRHIETIPKRGYRLLPEAQASGESDVAGAQEERDRRRSPGVWVGALALLAAIGIAIWSNLGERQASAGAENGVDEIAEPVLAVLPFDYQGTDRRDAHLADGLADEVLSMLSRSADLSVIAGTSSFRFRDDRKNLDLLRRELSITHVVDGNVRQDADGLRVSAHLVNVDSGLVLWSDVFKSDEAGIYTIPEEIGRAVLSALSADPNAAARARQAPDPRAYEAYLHARVLLRDGTPDNLRRAIRLLRTAIGFDALFAEAQAQLAVALLNVLITRPDTEDHIDPVERSLAARSAAEQALALDPDSIDARLALAVLDYRERKISLAEAEARFRELVERAPNHPNVNMRMGMMLNELGHVEEAYRYHRRAYELDRLSGLRVGFFTQALYLSGRLAEAHALIWEVNRLWAIAFLPIVQYATYLAEGRFGAVREWLRAVRQTGEGGEMRLPAPELLATLEVIVDQFERHGTVDEATLGALDEAMASGLISPFNALQIYGAIGRLDDAHGLLLERLAVGDRWFRVAPFSAPLGALRKQPRIMQVFAESGQLQYWLSTGRWPDFCNEPDLPYDCRAEGIKILQETSASEQPE